MASPLMLLNPYRNGRRRMCAGGGCYRKNKRSGHAGKPIASIAQAIASIEQQIACHPLTAVIGHGSEQGLRNSIVKCCVLWCLVTTRSGGRHATIRHASPGLSETDKPAHTRISGYPLAEPASPLRYRTGHPRRHRYSGGSARRRSRLMPPGPWPRPPPPWPRMPNPRRQPRPDGTQAAIELPVTAGALPQPGRWSAPPGPRSIVARMGMGSGAAAVRANGTRPAAALVTAWPPAAVAANGPERISCRRCRGGFAEAAPPAAA